MSKVKLAVVFYSKNGANLQLAKWAEESAQEAGAEVRIVQATELAPQSIIETDEGWMKTREAMKDIPEATSDDLDWADAIVFSVPTRFGNMPSQMKQFLDIQGGLWAQGKTVNKVVTAMATAGNPHGGQEATILSLYTAMMHWGAIVVAPGYTDDSAYLAGGNPYGTSATVDQEGQIVDNVEAAVKHQVKRAIEVAAKVN
ncbi:MAG TPA: NAD(P)H:quinone oxidoreductase [Pseudogracilibacillus sp.]|nr:NAD(P)H:quinone oxidoreductase [Pseudogracilibacillus sp.]